MARIREWLSVAVIAAFLLTVPAKAQPAEAQPAEAQGKQSKQGTVGERRKDEQFVSCTSCNNKSVKPCKKHKKRELADENDGVCEFCSDNISCKACGGLHYIDCTKCTNPDVEKRIARERKRMADWLTKRRKKVDELIRHEVLHGSSKHFDLVFDLKKMKVGKVTYSTHRLMHLYLRRLEEFRKSFLETMQMSPSTLPVRSDIYMWRDGRDQGIASTKFAGQGATGVGVKYMGSGSVYTMLYDKNRIGNDKNLHRNVVHNVAHLLFSNYMPQRWIGQLKGGWVDAGLAHYFEFKLDGLCSTYCYQEVGTNIKFKGGSWLVPIRKRVVTGKFPSVAELCGKSTDQLDGDEHAMSFSLVHYLFEGDFAEADHGKQFQRFGALLKEKQPLRDALRAVYRLTPLSLEEKWKEWVRKTYPKR